MDVFVFLFSGVDFLLLFLFTTVKFSIDVNVSIFVKCQQLFSCVNCLSLTNKSAIDQIVNADEAVEFGILVNLNNRLRSIKLMKENLHLWQNYNYINF